ncbi:hypothetical protein SAY86_007433 [Trapa natans]|uniref:C2H2-type domain-containing protein n=1 Tax=Trapa natans TaxID=22666 RepID=A0AAN7LF32_TRANT|nr:hypothetical protein SAY86_007433 [Trapa natans]
MHFPAMENQNRKLCSPSFSNGGALRGHVRPSQSLSHLLHHPVSEEIPGDELDPKLMRRTVLASSASPSSDDEDGEEGRDQGYGLRENPKKSVRLADPEFSFAGSVVSQDRESETSESSRNPTRRRSKRVRSNHQKSSPVSSSLHPLPGDDKKRSTLNSVEPEPVSLSISDAEGVAFCLMMLSRDRWKRQKERGFVRDEDFEVEEEEEEEEEDHDQDDEEAEEEEAEETDESEELENYTDMAAHVNKNTNRSMGGRYMCETCRKTFRSYQALGGHRASHRKANQLLPPPLSSVKAAAHGPSMFNKSKPAKVHECPYCSRVFSSGQALGGHKRSHTTSYGTTSITVPMIPTVQKPPAEAMIDLNLPAPVDEDDLVELSAVSDAEFLCRNGSMS